MEEAGEAHKQHSKQWGLAVVPWKSPAQGSGSREDHPEPGRGKEWLLEGLLVSIAQSSSLGRTRVIGQWKRVLHVAKSVPQLVTQSTARSDP